MKKIILPFFLLLVLAACTNRPKVADLQAESAELAGQLAAKDSLLNEVFASLNDISTNLTAIKDREGIITAAASPEISTEKRAQISQDIAAIDELLQKNRLALERLQGTTEQLRRANVRLGELESLIANYTKQIADKDADIDQLRGELESMQIRVAELNTAVDSLQIRSAQLHRERQELTDQVLAQDDRLHTVYYIVGSERTLRDQGILERGGGLFGGTSIVSGTADIEKFTRVDSRTLDRIVVGRRRATLVTPHPAGSYQPVMSGNVLQEILITDPDRFWETSKALVVSYK